MSVTTELICGKGDARAMLTTSCNLQSSCVDYLHEPVLQLFHKLTSALRSSVKELLDRTDRGDLYKIYFDFSVTVNENNLEVKRQIKVVKGTEAILQNTSNNTLQSLDGKTLKILKNGKKQRFIPSRNTKNVKNKKQNTKNE